MSVWAPVNNGDDIIQSIPSCNGMLHVISGIVLPAERYNASMYYNVPSSIEQANAVLSQWNASMLQNTYTTPLVVCNTTIWHVVRTTLPTNPSTLSLHVPQASPSTC